MFSLPGQNMSQIHQTEKTLKFNEIDRASGQTRQSNEKPKEKYTNNKTLCVCCV